MIEKPQSSGTQPVQKTVHLLDVLRRAKISAPHAEYVGIHRVTIQRLNRSSIFQHPPSRIEFQPILLEGNPRLRFACGIKQRTWPKLRHPVEFDIFIKTGLGRPAHIFHKELDPGRRPEDRDWLEFDLDLSKFSRRKVRLIFSTSVPARSGTEYSWSVWGDPQLTHDCPPVRLHPVRPTPAHVFLITADALRRDYLGVYGNASVLTPHCDRLAQEGALFSDARGQTASTLGSYASFLTGQSPLTHSITTEWGAVPKGLFSLPQFLQAHGYRTRLIPSELELIDPKAGLAPLFEEHSPCIGNPAQDGSITTRMALDVIGRQTKPAFFWIQYFDTHPPITPPDPFRSMYYRGDPADESRRYRTEAIAQIRGTESLKEILAARPALAQGWADAFLIAKLEATATALHGTQASDPDLAIHLKNLGPRSHRNMPIDQFASWLGEQAGQLKNGVIPGPLMDWLDGLAPMLREIDDDITTWLEGILDFRYPVSQYSSAVSYFDAQVGALCSHLRENGLFEQSLFVVTSPHGEILDEQGIVYDHHALMESCIRLPLIVKPPKTGRPYAAGAKIDGTFDSLDLFPTLADLLGLPVPAGLAGHSRSSHLYDGSPIPQHDSFAVNNSHTMASVTRGRYKFMKVFKDHLNSAQWRWHTGDRMLFDVAAVPPDTHNLAAELPELAEEMEQSLDRWLQIPQPA